MLQFLAPILGSAITAVGGLLGGKQAERGQEATNVHNAQQAELNRQFQERMSSTSYQRAVEDMKAAGLNPALAYQQGGASTPGGASATFQNPKAQLGASIASSAQGAAQVATDVASALANIKNIRAQQQRTEAETAQLNIESAARLRDLQTRGLLQETNAKVAEAQAPFTRALTGNQALGQKLANDFLEQTMAIRQRQLFADYDLSISSARDMNSRALLQELSSAEYRNRANAQDSWWMKNVNPYLNSALGVLRMLKP